MFMAPILPAASLSPMNHLKALADAFWLMAILAAFILPLALVTLSRALAGRFDRHRRIARWTLPIWLYVSVTGVVIYVMLYQMT